MLHEFPCERHAVEAVETNANFSLFLNNCEQRVELLDPILGQLDRVDQLLIAAAIV